jgi:hypothetical protein
LRQKAIGCFGSKTETKQIEGWEKFELQESRIQMKKGEVAAKLAFYRRRVAQKKSQMDILGIFREKRIFAARFHNISTCFVAQVKSS